MDHGNRNQTMKSTYSSQDMRPLETPLTIDEAYDRLQYLTNDLESNLLPYVESTVKQACQFMLNEMKRNYQNVILIKNLLLDLDNELYDIPRAEKYIKESIFIYQFFSQQPHQRLQAKATTYFQQLFGIHFKLIEFEEKFIGVQFGDKITITLTNGEIKKFYSKTHRRGLREHFNIKSSKYGTQSVDPKELFCYKVLELSGLGPEVHFFYYDAKNFYIATKDAGITFQTYDIIKNQIDTFKLLQEALNAVPPVLYDSIITERTKELQWVAIENILTQYNDITPYINGIIKIDIISHLLRISDTVHNNENFGFLSDYTIKVIDFEIIHRPLYHYDYFSECFDNARRETFCDILFQHILCVRDPNIRINKATEIFKSLAIDFDNILPQAKEMILNTISHLDLGDEVMEDFSKYVVEVGDNVRLFRDRMNGNSKA